MNKLTFPALAVAMAAGSAMGATNIKSINDLASSIVNSRGITMDDLSIGTLNGGESIFGDNTLSSNDMDGDDIGGGTGSFSWSGGDDVYSFQWGGGDVVIDLFFSMAAGTNGGDLDVYLVNSLNGGTNSGAGTSTSDNEQIVANGLAAGKYWIVVDGWQGAGNSYKLAVSPTPGAAAVFGLAGIAAAGRRRR